MLICSVFSSALAAAWDLRLGELNDLTGVQAAVAGQHKADHTNQGKQIQIGTAKHFDAENNGRKR